MSHKKVNKEEKRRQIALSCSNLIYEIGMKNMTVAQVAKKAGIGKGTVYEYFESKDDIIFEIINIHIESFNNDLVETINNLSTIKEKIEAFFKIVLNEEEEIKRHFNGYKEFLSIVLSSDNQKMKEFNKSKNLFFKQRLLALVNEAVENGELKAEALDLVDGLIAYQKGLAILKMSQKDFDANENFKKFIDTILNLVEVKK